MTILAGHLRRSWRSLLAVAGLSVLLAVPTAASGYVVARALDDGFLAGRASVGLAWLAVLALAGAAEAVLSRRLYRPLAAIVEPFRDRLISDAVEAGLDRALREEAYAAGAGVAQATEEVETARGLLASLLRSVHGSVSVAAGAVAGLVVVAPLAALIVLPSLAATLLGYRFTVRMSLARQRRRLLADEDVAELAALVFNGRRDIVSCAAEAEAGRSVRTAFEAGVRAELAVARARELRQLITGFGIAVPTIALFALAPRLVASGALSPGDVVGAAVYLTAGFGPALTFMLRDGGAWVVGLLGVLGRLGEIAVPAGSPRGPERQPDRGDDRPAVVLREVAFSYGPAAVPVLDGVSAVIPFGAHVAVVGPSGAGKSTLAALLCGMRQPGRGTVTVGGEAAVGLAGHDRLRPALVPQEAYVFAGTVRENLAYLAPGTADHVLHDIAGRFGLDPVIERLGGLDGAVPPGGTGLSAGERQLIALTRTYLAPAPIVILDEATCHLDPAAERRAEREFARRGGTLVVIAHRISSALHARRVMLVDSGHVVSGSHADLLKDSARYRELVGYWNVAPTT